MSLICHTFMNSALLKECHTWQEAHRAPVGAYIRFHSGAWYLVMPSGIKEYIDAWNVPKEYRTMALLLTN